MPLEGTVSCVLALLAAELQTASSALLPGSAVLPRFQQKQCVQ